MAQILVRGCRADAVADLKRAVAAQLGEAAAGYPGLADRTPDFDSDTEGAVRRWQSGAGLVADGIVGPHCLTRLGLRQGVAMEIVPDLAAVRMLFPQTRPSNIVRYLPYVTDALEAVGLVDRAMILAALGTIRAETAGFVPVAEYPSTFNTLPGQPAFSAYEPPSKKAQELGNDQAGDGAKYRGRGFVQLTGSHNYHTYAILTGVDLGEQPDLANAPEVASVLLALFLAHCADRMRRCLQAGDFERARRLVNGGAHGLDDFKQVFKAAAAAWPVAAGARTRVTRGNPPGLRGLRAAERAVPPSAA